MYLALAAIGALVLLHLVMVLRFRRLGRRLASAIRAAEGNTEVPESMRRFAERGGADGVPTVVELRQICAMRLSRGAAWQSMTARQTIGLRGPGFVWEARLAKGAVTFVRVIDAFVGGVGRLHVRLLGSIPVANSMGPDTDRGEVMRYLAELPWVPDAILRNGALVWRVLDDRTVAVSVALPDGPAAVRFRLDQDGDVVQVDADRPIDEKNEDGDTMLRPWRCLVRDYAEIGGRRIPREGEAGYIYEDGYEAYWRGRIVAYETRSME